MIYEDKPPEYDDSTEGKEVTYKTIEDTPPAYQALVEQLTSSANEVNNQIRHVIDSNEQNVACCKCCSMCCRSTLGVLLFIIAFATPIAMVAVGFFTLKKCPLQDKIPLWLVIFGISVTIMSTVQLSIKIYVNTRRRLKANEEKGINVFNFFFSIFIISWFLAGNTWVYQTFSIKKFDTNDDTNYCDQICYLVAFWIITSIWIIICLLCSLCCFCCFIVLLIKRRNKKNGNSEVINDNPVNNNVL